MQFVEVLRAHLWVVLMSLQSVICHHQNGMSDCHQSSFLPTPSSQTVELFSEVRVLGV
jgi:hypothetical protein